MESLVQLAVQYAERMHSGQTRKGTDIPYITHPLKVMEILRDSGCPDEVVIAGVLHDTLEDTEAKPEDIEKYFGGKVLALVREETEDKTKSWFERKSHTIRHLKNASLEVKQIGCADKLSNLRDIVNDYNHFGEGLWDRFGAPNRGAGMAWYYGGIKEALNDLQDFEKYHEYCELFDNFFGGGFTDG